MTDFMEDAPVGAPRAPAPDWFAFRKRHYDLWIAKTGEDGSLTDWQGLLRDVGEKRLTDGLNAFRKVKRKDAKINFSDALASVQEAQEEAPEKQANLAAAATKTKRDSLVWCICHSPKCYANEVAGSWKRDPNGGRKTVRVLGVEMTVDVGIDPLTPERRASLEALAHRCQAELWHQVGLEPTDRNRPGLYTAVTRRPDLIAWLKQQRAIP